MSTAKLFLAVVVALNMIGNSRGQVVPEVGKTSHVCLQSWMGTYLCAEGGGGDIVVANRREAKEWETFEMTRIDAAHVTLRAHNGPYLCAENGGGTVVVANRDTPKEWETFSIYVDNNGLVSLAAHNGEFLSAEQSGIVVANRASPKEWEAFRIVSPANANVPMTRIEVNVYKIGTAPLWHTGTVIDGREYYFQSNNRVESCAPRGMDLKHHRTMVRIVPGTTAAINAIRDGVIARWNGTRYDVAGHNCSFFTNDLLQSLGVPGLDQEYLDASGLAKGIRQVPGGATLQELIVKWPLKDKRLDKAFMDDLERLANLPDDTRKEAARFGGNVSRTLKTARDDVAREIGKIFGQ